MTRLWTRICKIVPKINVEQTKGNEGSYLNLYMFEDLAQGRFQKSLCVHRVNKLLDNLPN